MEKTKKLLNNLKIDPCSILFSEERTDDRLFKKLKQSKYVKDRELLKLVNLADSKYFLDDDIVPTRADYVEKREVDRSTLHAFDGPFQLLHAEVGNLEFFGKNATFPQYVLVIVDLYSSKVYVYLMRSRKQILQKMKLFYDEVRSKRKKGKCMRLQVDNEFQQVNIKSLNNENNVEMFTSSVRGGKAFTAEQNIRELKDRVSKLNAQKLKIAPIKIVQNSTLNMNLMKSIKYGLSPEEIESQSLKSERFRILFNTHRTEKTQKLRARRDRYDRKCYMAKRKKLRENLIIGEKVLVLAERIRKKDAPGKFYKQSVQNISYFNKQRTFMIRRKQSIDGITFY